jgi:antitoxin CcdA
MRMSYARSLRPKRVATNLSIPAEVVRDAKEVGLNLSEVCRAALVEAIRQRRAELWREENREAIEEFNERVERDGLFGDEWRKF